MENDIVPSLLETIESQFDERTYNSKKLKTSLQLLKDKKATYLDVNTFSIELGEILADILSANVKVDVLPDGKMYFNIAERILNTTMKKNYDLISNFSVDVQTELNHLAGLKIKGQKPVLNQDRIDGIVNRISSDEDFADVEFLLKEPIVNFSQSIVDDAIKTNAGFHSKSGLRPKIIRKLDGRNACNWCKNLAGSFDYDEAPDDIYRRHERCRCTVEYIPDKSKRQDVWSKVWKDPGRERKIEERKKIGLKKVKE